MDDAEDRLGTVTEVEGGYEIRFERRIDRPVEAVWAALTLPERVADWLGDAEIAPVAGGRFVITAFRDDGSQAAGTIRHIEPPRLLEILWDGWDRPTRFELAPDGAGCRLTLVETVEPRYIEVAWGWHAFLDALPGAADGARAPWDAARFARREALKARYQAHLRERPVVRVV